MDANLPSYESPVSHQNWQISNVVMNNNETSFELDDFPNDSTSLSSHENTDVQAKTPKEVELDIDTWMNKEIEKNPSESYQFKIFSQMLKEQINAKTGFIDGDVHFSDTDVTSLPNDLHVTGSLYLISCIKLESLPKIIVDGNLCLSRCTSLKFLSNDLTLGKNLFLDDCTSLEYLPEKIISMGRSSDGKSRNVYLDRCGLPLESLQELYYISIESEDNPQFIFPKSSAYCQKEFTSAAEGFSHWSKLANVEDITCPNLEKLTSNETKNLCMFLTRLIYTDECRNVNTRQELARRVIYSLKEIGTDNKFKEVACKLIDAGLKRGDDLMILTLDNINLMIYIKTAEKNVIDTKDTSGTELKKTAKQMMMLNKVDAAANEYVRCLSQSEYVRFLCKGKALQIHAEAIQIFRKRLQEDLDLPIKTQLAPYLSFLDITNEEIDAIGAKFLAEYQESELNAYLETWAPWQQHLRRQEVTSYEHSLEYTQTKI